MLSLHDVLLHTDGMERDVDLDAASQSGPDSVAPPLLTVHGALKGNAVAVPIAFGGAKKV